MNKAEVLLKKYSPMILTTLGAVGVVTTSIFASKATLKAKKIIDQYEENNECKLTIKDNTVDIIKMVWKPYIPVIISGLASISCIYGAHFLNKKTQASIMSAYALLSEQYKEYIEKSKHIYGEEAEKHIKSEVAKSKYDTTSINVDTDEHLFFDYQSMRYFETTFDNLKRAEDFVNQEYAGSGYVHLNTFYEALGIDKLENFGDSMGWCDDGNGEYHEIKFEHELMVMDDGLECFLLTMNPPTELYFL